MKKKITKLLSVAFGLMLTGAASNAQVVNDSCTGAISLNSILGGAVGTTLTMGPYDNTNATYNSDDPLTGWACYGEPNGTGTAPSLENTMWFTFTGDGFNYIIETGNCAGVTNYIDFGDTQFSLYTGTCGSLVPLICNEDGPNAGTNHYPAGFFLSTTLGTVYYLMVDGYSDAGTPSTGEYCMLVTKQNTVLCSDPSVTTGTQSQNVTNLCFGDTLTVTSTGVIAPNVGTYFGIGWIISTTPITGSVTPLTDTSVVATYAFTSPAPSTSSRSFVHDGTSTLVLTGNSYYWTPVVFGNGSQASPGAPVYLHDLSLDPLCTYTGTSMLVNMLVQGSPSCVTGIEENLPGHPSSLRVYPSPASTAVTLDFTSSSQDDAIVRLADYTGRTLDERHVHATPGVNSLTLPVSHLASGIYFVTVTGTNGKRMMKFIKE